MLEQRGVTSPPAQTIAAAFAASAARAALMPYLMGGFPDVADARARSARPTSTAAPTSSSSACRSRTRSPTARSSTPPGTAALARGRDRRTACSTSARELAERVPVVLMCYANLVLARGAERFADELAERGVGGLIVPDLPLEEARRVLAACDAAGVALVPLVAPTTPDERLAAIGRSARGFVYTVSVTGTTGERGGLAGDLPASSRARRPRTDVPVALGFGIATPERRPRRADAGADGVIVGSRLVRAAAESDASPPTAVRALVAGFAARAAARIRRAMGLLLTAIAGLVVWVVLWALGVKAFDAFMIIVLMVLIAATARIVAPYLPGNRSERLTARPTAAARLCATDAPTCKIGELDCVPPARCLDCARLTITRRTL